MKKTALFLARVLATIFRLIPFKLRRGLLSGLMLTESRIGPPDDALKRLFAVSDDLPIRLDRREALNRRAVAASQHRDKRDEEETAGETTKMGQEA